MAKYKDIISRVKTPLNKGIPSISDRLSARYIISVALSKRSRILKQEKEKKNIEENSWLIKTIDCLELVEATPIECACLPSNIGICKVLRTKHKIPESELRSVSFIDGTKIPETDFTDYGAYNRIDFFKNKPKYYFSNDYLYIINEKYKKFIRISLIPRDEDELIGLNCNSDSDTVVSESCCTSYLEKTFSIPDGLLDSVVTLTIDEIVQAWSRGKEDNMNNGKSNNLDQELDETNKY